MGRCGQFLFQVERGRFRCSTGSATSIETSGIAASRFSVAPAVSLQVQGAPVSQRSAQLGSQQKLREQQCLEAVAVSWAKEVAVKAGKLASLGGLGA